MDIPKPYLLFLGDAHDDLAAKTAWGVLDWRPEHCIGQRRLPGCVPRLDAAELTIEEAVERGARTLILGVANRGGFLPDAWVAELVKALDLGMHIASGLHTRVADIPAVRDAADRSAASLFDVRHPEGPFRVAHGKPRSGHRLLTVGTDCSVGKMYTSLALEREMRSRGAAVDFRATGQTGILIDGRGVSVDAVVADFISGSVEDLCPAADDDHWDMIEGQGSLFHASYAGVSLGLLHGAQPDKLVLCHEPTRTHMRGLPEYPIPDLTECMAANESAARLVSPTAEFCGIAVNTRALDATEAQRLLDETADRFGIPCVDPVRTGVGPIVDRLL